MPRTKNRTTSEGNANAASPVPVHVWQIHSTGQHVEMRLYAEGPSDVSIDAGQRGFRLAPEQARQLIRDLSAAVLAMDVNMLAAQQPEVNSTHAADNAMGAPEKKKVEARQ